MAPHNACRQGPYDLRPTSPDILQAVVIHFVDLSHRLGTVNKAYTARGFNFFLKRLYRNSHPSHESG